METKVSISGKIGKGKGTSVSPLEVEFNESDDIGTKVSIRGNTDCGNGTKDSPVFSSSDGFVVNGKNMGTKVSIVGKIDVGKTTNDSDKEPFSKK